MFDVQFPKPITQHCFATWLKFKYFFAERHLVLLEQRFQDLFAACILQSRPPNWVIHILHRLAGCSEKGHPFIHVYIYIFVFIFVYCIVRNLTTKMGR